MNFAGRLGTQIHDEIGTAKRQADDALARRRDFVRCVIAARRFQRRHDLDRTRSDAAFRFELRQHRIGLGNFTGGLGARDNDARETRLHACMKIVMQRSRIDLSEDFRTVCRGSLQRAGKTFARRIAIGLDDEFGEVDHDDISARACRTLDELGFRRGNDKPRSSFSHQLLSTQLTTDERR